MINLPGPGSSDDTSNSAHNNIAILLQTPIQRTGLLHSATSGLKGPSRGDITPVTLSPIPHVDPATFRAYISQVGPLFEAFRRAQEASDEEESRLARTPAKDESRPGFAQDLSSRLQQEQRGQPQDEGLSSVPPGSTMLLGQRRSTHKDARSTVSAHPLSIVPTVYFDSDFHLENPRTFDVVSEHSDIIPPEARFGHVKSSSNGSAVGPISHPRKTLSSNAVLQEKMSWYLDTVEVHLIAAISASSDSFFEALGSLKALHAEASDSVLRIGVLRQSLKKLDQDIALGGLDIVAKRRRRENIRQLGQTACQLKQVVRKVQACEDTLGDGDLEGSIDQLEYLEKYILGEDERSAASISTTDEPSYQEDLRDLSGLRCLQSTARTIDLLRIRIGKDYESRFLGSLLADLRRHAEEIPNVDTLRRWERSYSKMRTERYGSTGHIHRHPVVDEATKASLRASLRGLARCRYTASAATSYRESILREMKLLIRAHLPSSTDDDNISMASGSTQMSSRMSQQDKSSILARNLRNLDPGAVVQMLCKMFCGISEVLRKLSQQVKSLLDITSNVRTPAIRSPFSPSMASSTPSSTPTLGSHLPPNSASSVQSDRTLMAGAMLQEILDLSSLMGQAVILAQTQLIKILKVRSEQTSRMPLDQFLIYFNLVRRFADDCEALSGRDGAELKGTVNGHINEFVKVLSAQQKQILLGKLETENWSAADFVPQAESTLNKIMEADIKDAEDWITTPDVVLQETDISADKSAPLNIQVDPPEPNPQTLSSRQVEAADGKEIRVDGDSAAPSAERLRMAGIEGQKFILPKTTISMLFAVEESEHFISNIPGMAQEVGVSLADYLMTFNIRSRELVLGAEATKTEARPLKSINTRHLALSSQSLSFLMTLIPYVKEFLRRHTASAGRGFLMEFDRVKLAYQEHQIGIHEKLIEILTKRATAHTTTMRKISWDDQDVAAEPNEYMETICRETLTLSKVMNKHLPGPVVDSIMNPIFQSYQYQFTQVFKDIPIKSENGRQGMLRDVDLMREKLGRFAMCIEMANELSILIKTKTIPGTKATDEKK